MGAELGGLCWRGVSGCMNLCEQVSPAKGGQGACPATEESNMAKACSPPCWLWSFRKGQLAHVDSAVLKGKDI